MRVVARHWFALALVAAAWVMSVTLYRSLPATIAIHWNARGVVDGWAPKWEGAFVVPCFAVILLAFLISLERWARNDEEGAGAQLGPFFYPTLVAAVAALCFYVSASVLLSGVGLHLDVASHAIIGAGLVIAVLGNTLGTSPKAPWRIAGWLLVAAGIVTVIAEILVRVSEAA
jgi:uncharacterized membrane protein